MELLKLLSANEIVAQIICFFLVLWLLRVFMWKRTLKLLDARRDRIISEYNKIEATKAEIAKIKADYESRIASIQEEARKKIQEAVEEGRDITDYIRKKAHQEAQDIIENAKSNMKYELAKTKVALKEELIDITIKAAEALIEEKLGDKQDKKIIEGFLTNLDKV